MKPSIPKGTRDFSPTEVANRTYIINTIKKTFETFGFQPIETPSFENSSTLMGKYGEEGDRLIFKILNSGDYLKDIRKNILTNNTFSVIFFTIIDGLIDYSKKNKSIIPFFEDLEINLKKTSSLEKIVKETILDFFTENKNEIITFLNNDNLNFLISLGTDYEELVIWKEEWYKKANQIYLNKIKVLDSNKNISLISEKALRYDLTVPFARYVVQHQNDITFPFKRYQIQPVWRADRPQKGRFREFFQCDADVVGSKSLWQEVEFVQLYDAVFTQLGLAGTTIKINNRKILSGIAEVIGAQDKLIGFTVALDKLDKIGKDGVVAEMISKGITETAIEKMQPLFDFSGSNLEKLTSLETMLSTSEEGKNGVEELRFIINSIAELGLETVSLEIDVTLARGLNYYTGAIFEVAAPKEVKIGSIGGGGRYDDLTGIFGLKDVSGIGISFGLDRIYLVLQELNLFKTVELPKPKVVFLNFNVATTMAKMKAIKELRKNGVKCEIYPDVGKSNKQQKRQWKYAVNRGIEFVISKVENDVYTLKNIRNSEQSVCSLNELIEKLT